MIRLFKTALFLAFLVLPVSIIYHGRIDEAEENNRNIREELKQNMLIELRQIEEVNDVESQLVELLLSLSLKISTSTNQKEMIKAYQEKIKPLLPPHELFFARFLEEKGHSITFKAPCGLGFENIIDDYLDIIEPEIIRSVPKIPAERISSLVGPFGRHTGISMQMKEQKFKSGKLQIFQALNRDRALFWKELPNGRVFVIFLNTQNVREDFANRIQAENWSQPLSGLAFLSKLPDKFPSYFSAFFPSHPKVARFLKKISYESLKGHKFLDFEDYIICVSPASERSPYRTVLVKIVTGAVHMPPVEKAAFFVFHAVLIILGLWFSIERSFFGRGPRISVRFTLLFSFIFAATLPLMSLRLMIQRFLHERTRIKTEDISANLHRDLVQIDEGSRLNTASVTTLFREFCEDPRRKTQISEAFSRFNDEKKLSEWLVSDLFCAIPIDKFSMIITGANKFSSGWVLNNKEAEINDLKKSLLTDLLSKHDRKALLEENPNLEKNKSFLTENKPGKSKFEASDVQEEMMRDIVLSQIGPTAYMNILHYSRRFSEYRSKSNRIVLWGEILNINENASLLLRWILTKNSLDRQYLQKTFSKIEKKSLPHSTDVTVVFTGNFTSNDSVPFDMNYITEKYPDLRRLSEVSFYLGLPVWQKDSAAPEKPIIEVLHGEAMKAIFAGQRSTAHLDVEKKRMANLAFLGMLGAFGLAVFIALAGAIYFLAPLRIMVNAVEEIKSERYAIRLDDSRGDEFGSLARAFNSMAKGLQEGKLFEHFVSTSVKKAVKASDSQTMVKSAELCEVTILFSSIHSFEEFQHTHTPNEVFALLQKHLSAIDQAIIKYGGEIDKLIGEKIMVLFRHHEFESAKHATLAALAMAQEIKTVFEQKDSYLAPAIGINSGTVVSGVLGASSVRLDLTVIGDPVNLAARLGALAHSVHGSRIVISESTKFLAQEAIIAEELPIHNVKGKTQAIRTYLIQELRKV